ncbi:response regulator [Algimonas porphyrae]|uniref:Response regulatory domain-containing protein n=1 Tax=Algimonas porphyrae TaxID=1128113 RepID=A0ABQ5V376_9PROT|nr:response regulator [Algimonas porphyrae]GLQ21986.1 hypothetical protein GCM10007854_29410 [Algimonas porphyrae]
MTARILIVDDSTFDRRMIRRAITATGNDLEVAELSHGAQAVEMIRRDKPCMTLLDIRMPGTDGFSVLSDIRSTAAISGSVVVMLSGSDQPLDHNMAQELGADAYYVKPESAADYMELGRNICDTHLPCLNGTVEP